LESIEKNLSIKINREVKIGKYFVDGVYENFVIEFYGDFWHCNPKKFNSNDYNSLLKMTAGDKWKIDKKRIEYIEKKGYNVIKIWENDWKNDKEGIIKECIVKLKK